METLRDVECLVDLAGDKVEEGILLFLLKSEAGDISEGESCSGAGVEILQC